MWFSQEDDDLPGLCREETTPSKPQRWCANLGQQGPAECRPVRTGPLQTYSGGGVGGSNSSMAGKQVRLGPTIPRPSLTPSCPVDASKANSCTLQDDAPPNPQEASRDRTGRAAAPSTDD